MIGYRQDEHFERVSAHTQHQYHQKTASVDRGSKLNNKPQRLKDGHVQVSKRPENFEKIAVE